MSRYILLFLLVAAVAFGLVYLPPVREHVIGPFTVGLTHLSGTLIDLFGGAATVHENYLSIPGFSVQVMDMCNGVEATIVLISAMIAFPAPAAYKMKGLLLGVLSVHALNIIRIISLIYLGVYRPDWFHWVHWYLWDALIMADILVAFLVWLHFMPGRRGTSGAVPA